jgi:outer membrane protein assembly factor BamB
MSRSFSLWLAATVALLSGVFFPGGPDRHLQASESGQSALTVHWQSQVMLDSSRDRIAEMHLHVHDDRAVSYYEIRFAGFRETVAFDDLNPRGVPFRDLYPDDPGRGAREWAELKKDIYEAEGRQGVTIELITVPYTTLYALTGSGIVHAIDAETGETRWKTRLGMPKDPAIGIASNNTRVIVVRGSRVYCLDASDGNEIWARYAHYAPGGGVAMSDDFAYVTSIEGRLQMFPLNETGLPESFFASTGPATFDPSVTPRSVSWATEKGYFNVARSNVVSLRYRLETNDSFESAGTFVGGMLIANSTQGKVYAMSEREGNLVWEFAVGEYLAKKPVPVGNRAVMLITGSNNLVPLDVQTGSSLAGWPSRVPGITAYVGASQNILYFKNGLDGMVGLNRDSGAAISMTTIGLNTKPIPNHVTDRLYLVQPDGFLVCMRELANLNPVIIGEEFEVGSPTAGDRPDSGDRQPGANPFERGMQSADPDNPFARPGGAAQPGGDPADPFAGNRDPDDPFSGGVKSDDKSKDKSGDDPFGGDKSGGDKSGSDKSGDDDDPFGGNR